MTGNKYTNRLSGEKSPYLLQHAHNPVEWFPWGDKAFSKATVEDKPIFLSIGYSTCHWCHVMERESFEDEEVAEVLNMNFISIKVDREERPDIDHIYMSVCQALTGQGGWPLTIIMTPDKKPFFSGTYFPKLDRMGLPGIISVLNAVNEMWHKDRASLMESGKQIVNAISQQQTSTKSINAEEIIKAAYAEFKQSFDSIYGGFRNAPKFPTPHNLYFLLRYWYVHKDEHALKMVEKTLDSMYKGGIFDHISGGFSRYSTDRKWLTPHFEKMLYDNALLAIAYLETYHITKKEDYADVAKRIFAYVLRDMTSPEGGFYSAEDADSEGVEGKFYTWSAEEVGQVLGNEDGARFCSYYDITVKGNFEGKNIPNLIKGAIKEEDKEFIDSCRQKLFEYREKRIHPYKDDKILTSWNGLMIAAMAIGGRILGENKYTEAAEKAALFIISKLVTNNGRLMARYRDGETANPGYVDDYAFFIWGLLELYEATYKPEYLLKALEFNDHLLKYFLDEESGGLFLYASDSEQLLIRPKEIYDGATPSGNSVSAFNMLRLARLTGDNKLEVTAMRQFMAFGSSIEQVPSGYSFMLTALLFAASKSREVVVVSGVENLEADRIVEIIREDFRPFTVSTFYSDSNKDIEKVIPFIKNYISVNGKATAYICENFACSYPVINTNEFKSMLS